MKKFIAIPVEILIAIDEKFISGKITNITVKGKPISYKEAQKLYKKSK